MSRGGRGGWGGRGGGRGRGGFMPGDRGGMGSKDMYDALKQPNKYAGMLYPPLDQVARLDRPDMFEEDIMRHTMQMEDMLLHGPHGLASGSGAGGGGAPPPPWRLANPRKTVTIEIEQWSDRFDPHSSFGGGGGSVAGGRGGRGGIDPETMYMNPTFFPESLWKEYFDSSDPSGGGRGKGKGGGGQGGKKRKRPVRGEDGFEQDDGDSDGDGDGDGKPDVEDEVGDNPSQSEDSDFDFDDDGTDHQDYDHNYFDNGEGDDDSGGDDDDGGGGDD